MKDCKYTERIKKKIGFPEEGRQDFFNLAPEETIANIKEHLKDNFSVNLWTLDWPNEQIKEVDKKLFDEKIVHCWDEVFDSFVCFNSYADMIQFYVKLRKESTEEQLQELRNKRYNTPTIRWFEKLEGVPTSNKVIPQEILDMFN